MSAASTCTGWWPVVAGDLPGPHAQRQEPAAGSGGLTGDNIGVEYAGVVYGIAESPVEKGLIWAGTNDGLVQLTRDAGKTWTNVTKNVPNLPGLGRGAQHIARRVMRRAPRTSRSTSTRSTIETPSSTGRRTTAARGRASLNGIPKSMLSYAKVIYEDPKRRGMLYVGTENAIYVSFDDGELWQPLQTTCRTRRCRASSYRIISTIS